MPVYDYQALDSKGKNITGIIDADSAREARVKLRSQNLMVTELGQRVALVSLVHLAILLLRPLLPGLQVDLV